jgi:S1-C subfamily serine protease
MAVDVQDFKYSEATFMVFRRGQIFLWLAAGALLATFVIGSTAGPVMLQTVQSSFQIVTPSVTNVVTQDVTPEIAQALNMSHPEGVVVTDLLYNPLQRGDVIVSINGHPIGCQSALNDQLAQLAPGQALTLEIIRDGRMQTLTVQSAVPAAVPQSPTADIRGISVASLSTQNGVVVTDVLMGAPASDAGLKSGDVILDVGGQRVHSASEFLEFMQQLNTRDATFNVRHTNGRIDVFVLPA